MGTYTLFNQTINFSDAKERFFDIYYSAIKSAHQSVGEFTAWYENCGDILTVLKSYEKVAAEMVVKYANRPLFESLTELEIYDVSEERYDESCFSLSDIEAAFEEIADKYDAIVSEQEAAREYRTERKASRGRVVGGGFGVGGAIKGMATAGAMNAVSGMGHSIANAIGNAGSAIAAAADKRALYRNENTRIVLAKAIHSDIINCYFAHMDFINEIKENYYDGSFDLDKGGALFESAKKVKDKQKELLLQSLENYPWNEDLFVFAFCTYQEERKNVWNIAKRFHIDLADTAEEVFAHEYAICNKTSEEDVQRVKQKILIQMKELEIDKSETINTIELDGVRRVLKSYPTSDEIERQKLFDSLKAYDASNQNKALIIKELFVWELARDYSVQFTADETEAIIKAYYTDEAKRSEDAAVIAKEKIKKVMTSLNVKESQTLNELEMAGVRRIFKTYPTSNEVKRKEMFKALKAYDASDINKACIIKEMLIWEIARDYSVKFTADESETILGKYYTGRAKQVESEALIAKEKIQEIMAVLGIRDSQVFNNLEKDCVARICNGYETANEETCNTMLEKVKAYDVLYQNKQEYINQIQKRIEEIWSAEDGEIFDNVYLNTDIYNPDEINKSIAFIKEKGRTDNAAKYLTALLNCNNDTIKKAFAYKTKSAKNYLYLGWGCTILAIVSLLLKLGFWALLSAGTLAGVFFTHYFDLKKAWNILTLDGTLVHKSFSEKRKRQIVLNTDVPSKKRVPIKLIVAIAATIILVITVCNWLPPKSPEKVSYDFSEAFLIDFDIKKSVSLMSDELKEHYFYQLNISSDRELINCFKESFEVREKDNLEYYGDDWKAKIIETETIYIENDSAMVSVSISHEGSDALFYTNIDKFRVYLINEDGKWLVDDFEG